MLLASIIFIVIAAALGLSDTGVQTAPPDGTGRRRFRLVTGVNLNLATTDVAIFGNLPAKWRPSALTFFDESVSLSTVTVGLYTAAAAGGTQIISGGESRLSGATGGAVLSTPTLVTSTYYTGANCYLYCSIPQGVAATASALFEYIDLTG